MNRQERAKKLNEMRRLYDEERWDLRQIAAHYRISWQAVHERFMKNNVPLRPKGRTRKVLDRETLVRLYVEEGLSMQETAVRLEVCLVKLESEFKRHKIEKRSGAFFKRKYPELYQLKIGEQISIPRPSVTNPYRSLYQKANRTGIKISIKTINQAAMRITRTK